jgi:hypothetical protein
MACALHGLQGSIAAGGFRIVFPREPANACVAIVETADHHIGVGRANMDGTFDTAASTPAFEQNVRLLLQREFEPYGRPSRLCMIDGETALIGE